MRLLATMPGLRVGDLIEPGHERATRDDAGPTSCVIALGPIRATYSRRAVERVLKWLDTEVTVPVSDDMGVWLGLHVVPVWVLRAAAAEMGRA